jgi:hypothetical protein
LAANGQEHLLEEML